MATSTSKLGLFQFNEQYEQNDHSFEYWYGEAVAKSTPTWVHGLLQKIMMRLLEDAGFLAASEVEIRIDPEARPKPDVVAIKGKPNGEYLTAPVDVVVEIISKNDSHTYLKEKCRKYQEWGFGRIFVVDPSDKSVMEWREERFIPTVDLFGIPSSRIWRELDRQYSGEPNL